MLTLADGSMAPFDYKFAEDRGQVYHNLKMQSALYGLLIRETFQCPCTGASSATFAPSTRS